MEKNKDKNYNWWKDPKNQEEVKKYSWWEHENNMTTIELPISIVNGDGYWCVTANSKTKELAGGAFDGICSSEKTKEEAIREFFKLVEVMYLFREDESRKFTRWVPFKKGPWSSIGGKWFTVFGFGFSFRYGKNMRGGFYIPFTKLNISMWNEWTTYKKYKQNKLTP